MHDLFSAVDAAMQSGSPRDVVDMLAREFREMGRYDLLFEARGMAKRLELGLPLIQTEASSSFPEPQRSAYEQAVVAAAREAGELYLQAGNIPAGYRYLRAIGETAAVAEAIEKAEPGDDVQDVIAIAFQEGVHPAKGLELILKHHGMCQAITAFGMYAVEKDRERCLRLLVRQLHSEVMARMGRIIEDQEGAAPSGGLRDLMHGREWLFGDYDYYVDTSHLTSLIAYSTETTNPDTLRLLDELCEYGQHLSPNFAFRAQPPFENGYGDYSHYIKAVLGEDTDEHLHHFEAKAAESSEAAQLLVSLLSRLERNEEALEIFARYLKDEDPAYLRCPSAMQLAFAAAKYDRLQDVARERGDLLSYAAASVLRGAGV